MDSTTQIDYKSIPSNPLKGMSMMKINWLFDSRWQNSLVDLIAFEERIQHNMNSLKRLRFQALSKP